MVDQQNAPGRNEFKIKDCALIAIATGARAMTLKELRDALLDISHDSVYYHFWGGALQPRFEEREYNNDFAAWSWYALHDATLAERLAVIDPMELRTLEAIQQELIEIIEERIDEREELPYKMADAPFEFIRSQIVVFDTHKVAKDPKMLAMLLPDISASSIFYHFIDARRRQPEHGNDFSFWLKGFDGQYDKLSQKLIGVDPYFSSLTQLKAQLVNLFNKEFQKEASK